MTKNFLTKTFGRVFQVTAIIITILGLLISGASPFAITYAEALMQQNADTTIVYITEDARALRLIQPDGSNDQLLWQVPADIPGGPIDSVMWRPDAQQIAFTSTHEATCSEFGADIYLINPDGSHLRRLTNGPACAELAAYPQGSVTVEINNQLANFSEYLVYVEGAPTAKVVTVPPGNTVLVPFAQVADLGDGVTQLVVAINGTTRWFDAGVAVDVAPGENAHAGMLTIANSGLGAYGATQVSWSADGTRLAYQLGEGRLWQVGVDVAPLAEGGPLLAPQINSSVAGTYPVWSPNSDELLYQRANGSAFTIARAQVDGDNAGTDLANVTNTSGIAWLNDGSGMVVADFSDFLLSHVDLYLMTFADEHIVQLTQTSGRQAAFLPGSSPDGSQIVYGYTEDAEARPFQSELHIMNIDGSGDHLLVADGRRASWSRVAPQNPLDPTATVEPTVEPTVTPQPTATNQSSTTATPLPVTTPQPTPLPTPRPTSDPGSMEEFDTYLPLIHR